MNNQGPPRPRASTRSPSWARFETYCQQLLRLKSTIASGNQHRDPGDGRTAEHYRDQPYQLMVDAKYTGQKSYSLSKRDLKQWLERAALYGCRFGLPIRFESAGTVEDYIVIPLEDYAEHYLFHVDTERDRQLHGEAREYLWWICQHLKDEDVRERMAEYLRVLGVGQ